MGKIRSDDHSLQMDKSVKDWLDENNISGGLRRYFHMVSASMMVCPFIEKASVGEMFINMQKVLQTGISAMYPRGGWQPIIDSFYKQDQGTWGNTPKVFCKKIKVKDGKAVGVFVEDKLIKAKIVISIPSHQLVGLLPDRVDDDYVQNVRIIVLLPE